MSDNLDRLWRNYHHSRKLPVPELNLRVLAQIWSPDSLAYFYENDRLDLDEFETLVGLHLGVT